MVRVLTNQGEDVVQLGAEGGKRALTAVAQGAEDIAVQGFAISAGKAARSLGKMAGNLGIVSGALDADVAAVDAYNTLNSNASPEVKAAAVTKFAIKSTILGVGFIPIVGPILGAALGTADAFGATDYIA